MNKLVLQTLLALLTPASLQAAQPTQYWNAYVTRVIDGDTIVVRPIYTSERPTIGTLTPTLSLIGRGGEVKIRLAGIDCPEKKQAYGLEATRFLTDRILGKTVVIQASGKDRYGRVIGTVWLVRSTSKIRYPHPALSLVGRGFSSEIRDLSLNEELTKAGLAWHYKKYSKDRILEVLENLARKAKRGLWIDSRPVTPWEWRRARKRLLTNN